LIRKVATPSRTVRSAEPAGSGLAEGRVHQAHPAIAGRPVDREAQVPHPEPRMAALLAVAGRATAALDQEVGEPPLGAGEVLGRVHRPEQVVDGHPLVERGDQRPQRRLAEFGHDPSDRVDGLFHPRIEARRCEARNAGARSPAR
jgi:hypothetical protein